MQPLQRGPSPADHMRVDSRPERTDFRPEKAWGNNKRMDKVKSPVFYRTSPPSGPLPKKHLKCLSCDLCMMDGPMDGRTDEQSLL